MSFLGDIAKKNMVKKIEGHLDGQEPVEAQTHYEYPTKMLQKFISVIFIPFLLILLVLFIIVKDPGLKIFFFIILALLFLLYRALRNGVDVKMDIYADHLIVDKKNKLLPGRRTQELYYKDIKKVKQKMEDPESSALWGSSYKVTRVDSSRITLPSGTVFNYEPLFNYCKAHGIEMDVW